MILDPARSTRAPFCAPLAPSLICVRICGHRLPVSVDRASIIGGTACARSMMLVMGDTLSPVALMLRFGRFSHFHLNI
jgi:hypothetical protein